MFNRRLVCFLNLNHRHHLNIFTIFRQTKVFLFVCLFFVVVFRSPVFHETPQPVLFCGGGVHTKLNTILLITIMLLRFDCKHYSILKNTDWDLIN